MVGGGKQQCFFSAHALLTRTILISTLSSAAKTKYLIYQSPPPYTTVQHLFILETVEQMRRPSPYLQSSPAQPPPLPHLHRHPNHAAAPMAADPSAHWHTGFMQTTRPSKIVAQVPSRRISASRAARCLREFARTPRHPAGGRANPASCIPSSRAVLEGEREAQTNQTKQRKSKVKEGGRGVDLG